MSAGLTRVQFFDMLDPTLRRSRLPDGAAVMAFNAGLQMQVLQRLAADLWLRNESHPALRMYLLENCRVQFKGEEAVR